MVYETHVSHVFSDCADVKCNSTEAGGWEAADSPLQLLVVNEDAVNVLVNLAHITSTVTKRGFVGHRWWHAADSPWQLLATYYTSDRKHTHITSAVTTYRVAGTGGGRLQIPPGSCWRCAMTCKQRWPAGTRSPT